MAATSLSSAPLPPLAPSPTRRKTARNNGLLPEWHGGTSGTSSNGIGPSTRAAAPTRSRSYVPGLPRRNTKGKEAAGDSLAGGYVDVDPFAAHPNGSASFVTYDHAPDSRSAPADLPALPPRQKRASILVAASDALSFTFRRSSSKRSVNSRRSVSAASSGLVLLEVMDISGPRALQEEERERERLRDAAAQSIGLGPVLRETQSIREESLDEEDESDLAPDELFDHDDEPRTSHSSSVPPSATGLSSSAHSTLATRLRAGSGSAVHALPRARSRTESSPPPHIPPHIPPFPATPAALAAFTQLARTLPRYHSSTSLLSFARAKQWKSRYVVLSSPAPSSATSSSGFGARASSSAPLQSYLHLFKSGYSDDKELERLEINEGSVVFVADEEVGGRKGVVKVGGVEVGAHKREIGADENGKTMWLLQIVDPAESQRWIAAVKQAVLAQRSMRAGLGMPHHSNQGVNEPRGDMDVMLSMRAQGLLPSPTRSTSGYNTAGYSGNGYSNAGYSVGGFVTPEYSVPHKPLTHHASASLAPEHRAPGNSLRVAPAQQGRPSTAPAMAVSALKTLFTTNGRPQTPQPMSATSDVRMPSSADDAGDDALTPVNTPTVTSSTLSPTPLTPTAKTLLLAAAHEHPPGAGLDRRIVVDAQSVDWTIREDQKEDQTARHRSRGSISLQPPPRRRTWTSPAPPQAAIALAAIAKGVHREEEEVPRHSMEMEPAFAPAPAPVPVPAPAPLAPAAEIRVSLEGPGAGTGSGPSSPGLTGFSFFGTPEHKAREPSLSSVSTFASGEHTSIERSSSSVKRWSRQSVLPKRLTPPAGPPPPVPGAAGSLAPPPDANSSPRTSLSYPYAGAVSMDRASSRSSSLISNAPSVPSSPQGPRSQRPWSKRASTSSAHSIGNGSASGHSPYLGVNSINGVNGSVSGNASGSQYTGVRTSPGVRVSMPPPPRPAPNAALPPTPGSDALRPSTAPAAKSSFAHRALRTAQTPPLRAPASALPPHEDFRLRHGRRNSGSAICASAAAPWSALESIPSSPIPVPSAMSPLPPPTGPLPAPPLANVARHNSLRQRLRMLSAPAPLSFRDALAQASLFETVPASRSPSPSPGAVSAPATAHYYPPSPSLSLSPTTPIGEPIIARTADLDYFLHHTSTHDSPTLPSKDRPLTPAHERTPDTPELVSLSPPPRRGSRQLSLAEREKLKADAALAEAQTAPTQNTDGERRPLPLSRQISTFALGVVGA